MGLLSFLTRRPAPPPEAKATPLNQLNRLAGAIGFESVAGIAVSELLALQVGTVLACVNRIAQDVATTPLTVHRELRDGSNEPARAERAWRLLHRRPNPVHTAREFRQMLTAQAALTGDGYAFLVRNAAGQVIEMWPLQRREVAVNRLGYEPEYAIRPS